MKKPTQGLYVRELIRLTGLGNPTVVRGISKLMKKGLITRRKSKLYFCYEANLKSVLFTRLKLVFTLVTIDKLVKEIVKRTRPNCIVLFGSGARGQDTERSDIDLFVQAKRQKFNTNFVENKLNRKINLLFEPDIKKLSKELLNNLANGVVIYGFLQVIK